MPPLERTRTPRNEDAQLNQGKSLYPRGHVNVLSLTNNKTLTGIRSQSTLGYPSRLILLYTPPSRRPRLRLIIITSIIVLFSPMPFVENPKDVHITGSTITHVEGNQNIYPGRDRRTKRATFDLPEHIILMIHLSYS